MKNAPIMMTVRPELVRQGVLPNSAAASDPVGGTSAGATGCVERALTVLIMTPMMIGA